jgi:uncharacterized Zn-binding protein involved in type VI secretion
VNIGFLPAWRGVPAAAAAAIQSAKQVSDTTIKVAEAATIAAAGSPAAPVAKAAEEATKAAAAAAMGSMITSMAGGADIHTCATPLPIPPHGPGVVVDGSPTVLFNNLPACRMTDTIVEAVGPPNKIAMGCMTVLIGKQGTVGNTIAGTAACVAAAGGRASNSTQQSFGNCGIESSRQIINQANPSAPVSEQTLMQQSINNGLASSSSPTPPWNSGDGGTNPTRRQSILANNGVPSTVQANNIANISAAVQQGRGVIAGIDAAPLWGGTTPAGSLHAVVVTGVEYDVDGNPTAVIVNDTGASTNNCGQRVPIDRWNNAVNAHPNPRLNVTNNRIW